MAHKYEEELRQISDFLEHGKTFTSQLDIPELAAVKMRLTRVFKTEQLFIHSLLGNAREVSANEVLHLKPMTHMFGKELIINPEKPVNSADVTPTDAERVKFILEVDDYYNNFLNIEDESLFNKLGMPGGNSILRAVAKKAGYADFDTAEIDINFIKGVKAAIEAKNTLQSTLNEASKNIKAKTGK